MPSWKVRAITALGWRNAAERILDLGIARESTLPD